MVARRLRWRSGGYETDHAGHHRGPGGEGARGLFRRLPHPFSAGAEWRNFRDFLPNSVKRSGPESAARPDNVLSRRYSLSLRTVNF